MIYDIAFLMHLAALHEGGVSGVLGVIKLSVNGKLVNGISRTSQKEGYICMEAEGAKIYFRNVKILELPRGVTSAEQSAEDGRL